MKNLKSKKNFKTMLLLFFVFAFMSFQFGTVLADNIKSNMTILKSGDTLEKTGFFSGDKINIAGTVNGTTFVSGSDIDISGNINGDLFVVGQNININGAVSGSVFIAGNNLFIDGTIENNIYSAGSNVTLRSQNNGTAFLAANKIILDEQSKIGKDLFAGGTQIFQHGTLGRDLFGSSDNISISGVVGKNATITAEDLYVESGEIGGNLKYDSVNKATISKDSKILGKTDWNKVSPEPEKAIFSTKILTNKLFSIIGALVVWFLIKLIRPNFWSFLAESIRSNPLKSLGFGVLALIVIPTAIFFLLISVVGVPLAFILICLYGISIYLSKIIVAVFIGSLIKLQFNLAERHKGIWLALLGLVILSAISFIPIISILITITVIILGFGSLVSYSISK